MSLFRLHVRRKIEAAKADARKASGSAGMAIEQTHRVYGVGLLFLAFPLAVVLLMTLGLPEIAMPVNPEDWSYRHVWAMMPMLYYLGLWRAKRRYQ